MSSVALRIREIRKLLGLKQEDFAAHLGVSQTSVSRWEKGVQEPDFMVMYEIGKLAGVDPMKFALKHARPDLDKSFDTPKKSKSHLSLIVGSISSKIERKTPRWENDDRTEVVLPMDIPEGHQIEAYLVEDDSYESRFPKGSIVFVAIYNRSRGFFPKNNDTALCFNQNYETKTWKALLYNFHWKRGGRINLNAINIDGSSPSWMDIDAATVTGTSLGDPAWPGAFRGFSVIGVVVASFIEESPGRLAQLEKPDPSDVDAT